MTDFCKKLHFDHIVKQNPLVDNVDDEENKELFTDGDENDEKVNDKNDEDGKEFDNDDDDYDEPGSGRRFLRGCSIS